MKPYSENIEQQKRLPKYWGRQQIKIGIDRIDNAITDLLLLKELAIDDKYKEEDHNDIIKILFMNLNVVQRHLNDGFEFEMYRK